MLNQMTLTAMAAAVRDGSIGARELVAAHLAQIERINPRINAFVSVYAAQALAAAGNTPPGPLHGVPVTVKDSLDIAGEPTLCGSKLRLGMRAAADATLVARLKAAGAIILGKTNCAEFLFCYETDNHLTGRTNNPWDLARTPGGSSGGEAAAISALCSPGGLGSDGGGSIRVPAHNCGIAGLKPTPGRCPASGHIPVCGHPGGLLGVAGPMARTAEDLKLLFGVLAGHDGKDPFSAPVPLRVPDLDGLRIGLYEQVDGIPVHPEVKATLQAAARACEGIGIPVEPFLPSGFERAQELWWFFFARLPANVIRTMIEGREAEVSYTLTELLDRALGDPAPDVDTTLANFAARDRMRAALLRQMERYPVLLAPPYGVPAWPHRQREFDAGGRALSYFDAMAPSSVFNLMGFPGVVIPFGFSSEGLPIGIQLVGRPYEEELLLEVAIRLEQARGPFPASPLAL
jgi:Asp-tRNA(Asn)/Glu-tRNA(Gln) amidotransferase A subunit family amidase